MQEKRPLRRGQSTQVQHIFVIDNGEYAFKGLYAMM